MTETETAPATPARLTTAVALSSNTLSSSAAASPARSTWAGPDPAAEYRRLVVALSAAVTHRDAELTAIERRYADAAAEAEQELAAAAEAARDAERRAAAATTATVQVDQEAQELWQELRRNTGGWLAQTLGDLPEPCEPRPGWDAARLLADAAERVDACRPNARRQPLPGLALALMPLLGAACAAAAGLASGGLVALGHGADGWHALLRVVGWMTFLFAPFAGVPLAARWADRRFDARLDAGAIVLIVLSGMAAACAVSLTVR